MKVDVEIEEIELENASGHSVDSVQATCSRCDHQTESYGTGDGSIRRCLALLREECPNSEENYYSAE